MRKVLGVERRRTCAMNEEYGRSARDLIQRFYQNRPSHLIGDILVLRERLCAGAMLLHRFECLLTVLSSWTPDMLNAFDFFYQL